MTLTSVNLAVKVTIGRTCEQGGALESSRRIIQSLSQWLRLVASLKRGSKIL